MPEDSTNRGIPLGEAVQSYAEPGQWDAYVSAQKKSSRRRVIAVPYDLDESLAEYQGRVLRGIGSVRAERQKTTWLGWQLRRDLFGKIHQGTLVASGYAIPRAPADLRVRIPADIFHDRASIDWRDSTIESDGLSFTSVLILDQTEEAVDDAALEQGNAAQLKAGLTVQRPPSTGPPGRPSSMYLVEREFKRRVKEDQTCATRKEQAEVLARWSRMNTRVHHPSRQRRSATASGMPIEL
jgi:hypothetical protein